MAWYKEGLGAKPLALSTAQDQYYQENDVLSRFISHHCNVGPEYRVHKTVFQNACYAVSETHITPGEMEKKMAKRGFPVRQVTIDGVKNRGYIGIAPLM